MGRTFSYSVVAYKAGQRIATAEPQSAETFAAPSARTTYDNLNGKTKQQSDQAAKRPAGFHIGQYYYEYSINHADTLGQKSSQSDVPHHTILPEKNKKGAILKNNAVCSALFGE